MVFYLYCLIWHLPLYISPYCQVRCSVSLSIFNILLNTYTFLCRLRSFLGGGGFLPGGSLNLERTRETGSLDKQTISILYCNHRLLLILCFCKTKLFDLDYYQNNNIGTSSHLYLLDKLFVDSFLEGLLDEVLRAVRVLGGHVAADRGRGGRASKHTNITHGILNFELFFRRLGKLY